MVNTGQLTLSKHQHNSYNTTHHTLTPRERNSCNYHSLHCQSNKKLKNEYLVDEIYRDILVIT